MVIVKVNPISASARSLTAPIQDCRRKRAAFTIVEVMMAVMVMTGAFAATITTLQRGFQSIDTARNLVIAGQIMQSEIEKMRVSPWSSAGAVIGMVDYTDASPAIQIDANFPANVASRFTVTRTMADPKPDMRKITLTVTWRNVDGRQLSRSYVTYYARYGLYDYFSS